MADDEGGAAEGRCSTVAMRGTEAGSSTSIWEGT